jgi:hypothetical protein
MRGSSFVDDVREVTTDKANIWKWRQRQKVVQKQRYSEHLYVALSDDKQPFN